MESNGNKWRKQTTDERALPLDHTIDPGLVNRRLTETIIGKPGMELVDTLIAKLPVCPEWQIAVRIDHIYSDILLCFCRANDIPTLGQVLAAGQGRMFCSTERVISNRSLSKFKRATSRIKAAGKTALKPMLEYSTAMIASDTLRSRLMSGADLSVVAIFDRKEGDQLFFRPLVLGFPWLRSENSKWADKSIWWHYNFFENFIEDFDEFSKVRDFPVPTDFEEMRNVSERAFKICLAKILNDQISADWGGEQSDHFTAHLHLDGRRVTGAFLLKGPARFAPMGLNHLGKNNDQIVRLSHEPADVLFVQHSHDVTPPVRATLRAFAVQPGRSRRYCIIDGRDSLRLLTAYGLLAKAISKPN
jgi:hypothetical protein